MVYAACSRQKIVFNGTTKQDEVKDILHSEEASISKRFSKRTLPIDKTQLHDIKINVIIHYPQLRSSLNIIFVTHHKNRFGIAAILFIHELGDLKMLKLQEGSIDACF